MKIRVGDKVKVRIGKDRGKVGVVERVYEKSERILVKGINVVKKHVKKSEQYPQGGKIEVNRPMTIGKVMVVCKSCKEPTRVGYVINKQRKKQRVCKKCKQVM